jgi:C-terminal processing protease CtpA/Prc
MTVFVSSCIALVTYLQMNIVGKAQTSYLPGVLVPEINAGGVAEQAGFQPGDIILRVGDYTVAANPGQVRCFTLSKRTMNVPFS